jgi:uncharacterized membrane protein
MVFATIGDTTYDIVYLLHILAVVIAFAGGWTSPRYGALAATSDESTRRSISEVTAALTAKMHLPALVLAGLFGIGLIVMSEDVFEFSQTWISLAFLLWIVMIGVMAGLAMPAQRRLAAGETGDPVKMLAMATGIIHLLFLLMLIVMIWTPGL